MLDIQTLSIIIGIFTGLGILISGIGFGYAQFKTGASKAKDDLIKTLTQTLEIEKKKSEILNSEKNELVQSHQSQLNELVEKVGKLQGTIEAQDKKLEEYKEILQGRSPEQEKFMKFMVNGVKETSRILLDIKKEIKREVKGGE